MLLEFGIDGIDIEHFRVGAVVPNNDSSVPCTVYRVPVLLVVVKIIICDLKGRDPVGTVGT